MEEFVSQHFTNEHRFFSLKRKIALCSATSEKSIRDHAALLKYVTLFFIIWEAFLFLYIFLHPISCALDLHKIPF